MENDDRAILHVLVVGFHHKKGCQVEYSYPPLVQGAPNECPAGWKYLPSLALPDGSHNYTEDTVYFHLPSLENAKQTVFGISCFRQIPLERIKNRTEDMTRTAVQKSVCVLSRIPLYGQIQVKMALITHAYFDEGDFSKVKILEETYNHLNSVLAQSDFAQQVHVGLSAREFVLQWRQKALLLFKLVLLERRLIFYKSPVHPLCTTILTLTSLLPDMIERGLERSACIKLSRPMSPMPDFGDDEDSPCHRHAGVTETNDSTVRTEATVTNGPNECKNANVTAELGEERPEEWPKTKNESGAVTTADKSPLPDLGHLAKLSPASSGLPLSLFTEGYLCLPYLSLPYLDLLTDVNVRGYVVGATNVLFKQKTQLYDVLVDIDAARIECQDVELRKELHLTTEDLRFADYLAKHVSDEKHDVFLDGVGWEGGDEWIRSHFKIYLLCLLRTSLLPDGDKDIDHFNAAFMSAWRQTHNYKIWLAGVNPAIFDVQIGHPFAGQLSVADMKLRLAHTMQNTDGGRKLNQAVASTGRAVATTSKAVGGAISQAKGVFSNWWTNLMVSSDPTIQKAIEASEMNQQQAEENAEISDIPSVNGVAENAIENHTHPQNAQLNLQSDIHTV